MVSSTCNALKSKIDKINKVQNLNPKIQAEISKIQIWCWTKDLGRRWTLDFERSKRKNTKQPPTPQNGQLSWSSLWFFHFSWMGGTHGHFWYPSKNGTFQLFWGAKKSPACRASLSKGIATFRPLGSHLGWQQKLKWWVLRSRGSGLDSIYSGFRYTYR